MTWVVQDNSTPTATAAEVPAAKRSNAKRKKSTTAQNHEGDTLLTSTDTTASQTDTQDESKASSKSQRKRARHQKSVSLSEEDKNWGKISLFEVPEMPKSNAVSTPKKNKGDKKTGAGNKKGGKKSAQGEVVVADYGNLDDWGWTPIDTEGVMMDDMEGFLGLEELDGVNIDFEGSEETGKTIVFKVSIVSSSSRIDIWDRSH
jgi:hypothetical protein